MKEIHKENNMNPIFDKWCEKLLDTGKGNRLINYKSIKSRTVKIISPSTDDIFTKLSNGETLHFFDIDSYISHLKEIKGEELWAETLKEINDNYILNEVSRFLKKNDILAYSLDMPLKKLLKNNKKLATTSLQEKGINILYMAFGFLHWFDKNMPKEKFVSPLLLIPITLTEDSVNNTYVIHEYDDEITLNPTLSYKFKSEYGIDLPEYQDEASPDETLKEYLVRLNKFVENLDWYTSDGAHIGIFSFLKLNMYKDLKENESKILTNTNVRKLLNLKVENEKPVEAIDMDQFFKEHKELTLKNVVDADSSQITACVQAKAGQSFVLQGPPGTGKSQTITNLIAEYLYDNKKVLFVSEKLAALNVVYNNLKKSNLNDFCLELHSNKVNKKDVVSELYRVLNSNKKYVSVSAEAETEELKKHKLKLDEYAMTMHKTVDKVGKTPYDIINEIAYLKDTPTFEYALGSIDQKDEEYFKTAIDTLNTYSNYTDIIGLNYREHPFYGYIDLSATYEKKVSLKKDLKECSTYLQDILNLTQELNEKYAFNLTNFESLNNNLELLMLLSKMHFFDNNIFVKDKLESIVALIHKYNVDMENYVTYKKVVSETYTPSIYELDLKNYYLRYRNEYMSIFRVFNGKYRKDSKILRSYQLDTSKKLGYKDTLKLLDYARSVSVLESAISENKTNLFKALNQAYDSTKTYNYVAIEKELTYLNKCLTSTLSGLANIDETTFRDIQNYLKTMLDIYSSTTSTYEKLKTLQNSFDKDKYNLSTLPFGVIKNKFDLMLNNYSEQENWIRFIGVYNKLQSLNLAAFVDNAINNEISVKNFSKTFAKMYYTEWLYYIIDSNETISGFDKLKQDMCVQEFKKKDKLRFEIAKAEIISKLNANMPNISNMASGSQVSTLVREANKKRNIKPVRLLLKEVGSLIQTLKPVFLMSPLSVSTYLDHNSCTFDVVIFDEASQIFPWDAIGAISRAKQVIVVGDSKQMPPSNFFNAGVIEEEYSEDEITDDSLDFESILDITSAILPQNRLNWHYRSRVEELIAFSNAHFYENTLVTFPSSKKDDKDAGVEHYFVEGGIFDRSTKTNRQEAEKIVELVFDHYTRHPERSLGVVAFSISQQALIEDLLQDAREKNPAFEQYFDTNLKDPFFIKNLETVQGDERDTIIFSVAYAKDKTGKFYHNFGPLNKKGGERRLNVAVTRAKQNVKLVSSIKTFDIDLSKTESVGARLLKEYLNYAENGITYVNENSTADVIQNAFVLDVYNEIVKAGFSADTRVGYSGHKIDIAVKHKTSPDYVIAIECDGDTYKISRNTRDRDRLRQEVLERLGWKYYRLWSMSYFRNKDTEIKKMLEAINKAMEHYDKKKSDPSYNSTPTTPTTIQKPAFIIEEKVENTDIKSLFRKYNNFDFSRAQFIGFDDVIYNIVSLEEPITEELLLEKTVHLFGRTKVTDTVRTMFKYKMVKHDDKIFKVDDYYTTNKTKKIELRIPRYGDKPREITNIPLIELSSGLKCIIKNNVGISRDGLYKTMADLLGYTRTTDKIKARLNLALQKLMQLNIVIENDGMLFIK